MYVVLGKDFQGKTTIFISTSLFIANKNNKQRLDSHIRVP